VPTGIVTAEMTRRNVPLPARSCPSCGAGSHLPRARFCHDCGEALPPEDEHP
jgi:voltage-gated potassium channel